MCNSTVTNLSILLVYTLWISVTEMMSHRLDNTELWHHSCNVTKVLCWWPAVKSDSRPWLDVKHHINLTCFFYTHFYQPCVCTPQGPLYCTDVSSVLLYAERVFSCSVDTVISVLVFVIITKIRARVTAGWVDTGQKLERWCIKLLT